MGKNKALKNSKQAAWAAKQEKEGNKVINWIFGILVGLGVVYLVYTFFIM